MRRVTCRDHLTNCVFLNTLSNDAKLLWFWYANSADDDGFIGSPISELRYIGVPESALQELIDTRYVLMFTSGVLVMKHWKMHNTIPQSRYKPTTYQDEFKCLEIKDNGSYTEKVADAFVYTLHTNCKQNADKCLQNINQVKLNQINLNNIVQTPNGVVNDAEEKKPDFAWEFEQLWSKYPKKRGKDDAFRHYKVQRQKHTFEEFNKKLDEYLDFIKANKTEKRFILNGSTWFNGRWKDEYQVEEKEKPSYDIERAMAKAKEPIVYKPKNKDKQV